MSDGNPTRRTRAAAGREVVMTLRRRFQLGILALVAVTLAVPSILLYLLARQEVRGDVDQFVSDKARILAERANPSVPGSVVFQERDWAGDRFIPHGQTFDTDWNIGFVSRRLAAPIPADEAVRREAAHPLGRVLHDAVAPDGTRYRMATVSILRDQEIRGYAQIGVRESERDAPLRRLLATLVAGNLLALGLAWLGLRFLDEHWRLALASLGDTAREVSANGVLRHRFVAPPEDPDLAQVAGAFNSLLDRLTQTRESQQQFIADASHELRTPLTVLRGELEVALRRERTGPEYRETIEACRQEVERLSRLADNLLTLAHVDAGARLSELQAVDLGTACRSVAERFLPWAERDRITLRVTATESLPVRGDRIALERLLANLVENALRYSAPQDAVELTARRDGSQAVVEVADHGPGIAEDQHARIFERFHRVESSRPRHRGGAGLGLAIVKSLAELHGGSVTVRSRIGQGSTFTVRLPLARGAGPDGVPQGRG